MRTQQLPYKMIRTTRQILKLLLNTHEKREMIHFCGICGIGMSGIAQIASQIGYKVKGSDLNQNYISNLLENIGIPIDYKHQIENITTEVALVVKSNAVKPENIEIVEASKRSIPVISRAEFLAALMYGHDTINISGSHGKTTTTALIACILHASTLNPTVVNGGIINAYNSNAVLGSEAIFIAEADESDGSFLLLPTSIAIITNIEAEHMDFYSHNALMLEAYQKFIMRAKEYAILCIDSQLVAYLIAQISPTHNFKFFPQIITYGFSVDADIQAVNICEAKGGYIFFDVIVNNEELINTLPGIKQQKIEKIGLKSYGRHNIINALAAIIAAWCINDTVDTQNIREALAHFQGVKRRFTHIGYFHGAPVIDDYAHHPTEIVATLNTARTALRDYTTNNKSTKIIAIFQPHRYSRLAAMMKDFAISFEAADVVILTNVYSAGEAPIINVNSAVLAQIVQDTYPLKKVLYLEKLEYLKQTVEPIISERDIIVFIGAGDITEWAIKLINP